MRKIFIGLIAIILTLSSLVACDYRKDYVDISSISIALLFNNEKVIVDLYDNTTAMDFVTVLPITLEFDDYNSAEKTCRLPNNKKLNISDAPQGYKPSAGELGYYSPFGDIVIYHSDFSYASGIVPLGKIRFGEEKFAAINGKVTVKFELFDDKISDEPPKPEEPSIPDIPEFPLDNTLINIMIGDIAFEAKLENNITAQSFLKMLPMSLQMSELNANEKYYYLSENLPTVDTSPPGIITEGDLMLYGSNCIVLFYETFSSSYSYTRIGKILHTTNLRNAVGKGSVVISFNI